MFQNWFRWKNPKIKLSFAHFFGRQRQEEGRSDSEEEGVGGPEPLSESEQEDDISGEGKEQHMFT